MAVGSFECSLCGSVFARPSQLVSHECSEEVGRKRRRKQRLKNDELKESDNLLSSIVEVYSQSYDNGGEHLMGDTVINDNANGSSHHNDQIDSQLANFSQTAYQGLPEIGDLVGFEDSNEWGSKEKNVKKKANKRQSKCTLCSSIFANQSQQTSDICDNCKSPDKILPVRKKRGRPRKIMRKVDLLPTDTLDLPNLPNSFSISNRSDFTTLSANNKETTKKRGDPLLNQIGSSESQRMPKLDDNFTDGEGNGSSLSVLENAPSISSENLATNKKEQLQVAKLVLCRKCGRTFSNSKMLKAHEKTHTDSDTYKCEVDGCGKTFSNKTKYIRHATLHFEPQQYK